MPQMEPVGWLVWLGVVIFSSYIFFCVLWWVHLPLTSVGSFSSLSHSPSYKW